MEHRAVRERVGVIDLASRTLIRVTGKDRTRFLNGMLTNDIKALSEGTGCYTCLLSPQGKILADLEVYALSDAYLLELEATWKERVLDHLNKYVIADDVTFQEMDGVLSLFALQGPEAEGVLQKLVGPPEFPPEGYRHLEVPYGGVECRVIRSDLTGEEGFKLIVPQEKAEALWQALIGASASPVGMAAFNTLRIEAGIPWYGVDFDEGNFPQEGGVEERAVSFTKGCYIGQEFVIRIAHRGHVNRRVSGFTLQGEDPPARGDRILKDGKEMGRITSATFSPTLGKITALGMLRRECWDPGTVVEVESRGRLIPALVTPLPFYCRQTH
jgi:glycine cleavage system T protein